MLQVSQAEALTVALIIVALALLALAGWARVRGARTAMQPAVGAFRLGLSQAVSSYSFWIVLGASAAAYFRGLSAIWIAAGILAGALLNGLYVGPRLVRLRAESGVGNSLDALQPTEGGAAYPRATGGAAAIVFLVLLIGVIAQLRVAGSLLAAGLGAAVWIGVAIVAALGFLPALIGGRRGALDASTLCALLLPPIAVFLTLPAWLFASSTGGIVRGLEAIDPAVASWLGSGSGTAGIIGALGGFAFGFVLVGQPAVLDQFGVARDAGITRRAAVLTVAWLALVLAPMLLLGWSALVLYSSVDDADLVLLDTTARLLPPYLQSLPLIAVALAVAATLGHQLVTLGEIGALWRRDASRAASPQRVSRIMWIAAALSLLAAAVTAFGSMRLYVLTLVCLGVAVGPVMLVRLGRAELRPAVGAIAMRVGLISALLLLLVRSPVANSLAVTVSFLLAFAVAFAGRKRRLLD